LRGGRIQGHGEGDLVESGKEAEAAMLLQLSPAADLLLRNDVISGAALAAERPLVGKRNGIIAWWECEALDGMLNGSSKVLD
jgi:hypothetical protein